MAETTDTKVGQTKEEHQRLFYEWIASHSGTNSSLVTAKAYEDIKASLKGIPNHKPSRNLKKRLKRNNFKLISHEGLGLHDIVCVPADGTQIKVGMM